jgi:hypothetical protein
MMLRDRIRTFNKYVTNRLLRRFANCSRGPFAIIRHVGRRSGKPEPIDAGTALPAFPAPFRLIFRTFGRQEEFVQLKSSGPEPIRA